MRIVVTGSGGRLGQVVCAELTAAGHDVIAAGHADLDITDERVGREIFARRPDAIVNCSAYNDVDGAEADRTTAFAVNARGPALLAAAAEAAGATLVHYSSDFVFDGTAHAPYDEEAKPNPLNVYGQSKLAGELPVRLAPRHYILRVESLFGGSGVRGQQATIDWIAERLLGGAVVRAAVDRTVSPSYVFDVTRTTRRLLEERLPYGTYHCVNSGFATWYELATAIAGVLKVPAQVDAVTASALPAVAPRPRFCALDNQRLRAAGIELRPWQATLERHLAGLVGVTRPISGPELVAPATRGVVVR